MHSRSMMTNHLLSFRAHDYYYPLTHVFHFSFVLSRAHSNLVENSMYGESDTIQLPHEDEEQSNKGKIEKSDTFPKPELTPKAGS